MEQDSPAMSTLLGRDAGVVSPARPWLLFSFRCGCLLISPLLTPHCLSEPPCCCLSVPSTSVCSHSSKFGGVWGSTIVSFIFTLGQYKINISTASKNYRQEFTLWSLQNRMKLSHLLLYRFQSCWNPGLYMIPQGSASFSGSPEAY